METRCCKICNNEFELTEEFFYRNGKLSGCFHWKCKACYGTARPHVSGAQRRKILKLNGDPRYKTAGGRRRSYRERNKYRLTKKAELKAWISEIKTRRGCADCGYNAHPAALDFDHIPGAVKLAGVSSLVEHVKSKTIIEAEILKCEIVCSNCHRIRTFNRRRGKAPA